MLLREQGTSGVEYSGGIPYLSSAADFFRRQSISSMLNRDFKRHKIDASSNPTFRELAGALMIKWPRHTPGVKKG
jgi:hypothetical protein